MKAHSQAVGHAAAIFTIFVWGVTFISIKILFKDFSPVEVMFYRLALAWLALAAAWKVRPAVGLAPPKANLPRLRRPRWNRQEFQDELKIIGAGLCGATLYMLFQNIALSYTLATNVSVLVSVAPLLTALVSRLFLGEKLKAKFFIGFAMAMAGIILVAFNGSVLLKLNPLGDLLSILAALAWAFYSVLIKKISAQHTSLITVTRKVFLYGLLFLLPMLPLFHFRLGLERLADWSNLLHLLFLGVVASALCFVTWNTAVKLLGPVKTSVYIYVIPVVTVVAAAVGLKEPVTLAAAVGMGLILAGMGVEEVG